MPPVRNTEWLERLRQLHPLLEAPPPPPSEWAARQAEIDAASKADRDPARRSRDALARQRERHDDNTATTTWAGIVIVAVIALLGLFVTFRLIEQGRLEDCLLAHRSNCDGVLGR
jgi:hypothetical protein